MSGRTLAVGGHDEPKENASPEFFYRILIGKPVHLVWDALTRKEVIDRYYMVPVRALELVPGGKISYGIDTDLVDGEVLEVEAPNKLVHSFNFVGAADPTTTVTYKVEALEDNLSALDIAHTGFTSRNGTFFDISDGWPAIASSLKTLLETGHSLNEGHNADDSRDQV